MTTVNTLFAEDIYLKGEPISNANEVDLTEIENDIVTINATISGLTGVKAPADNRDMQVRTGQPTAQDDITEQWYAGDIWISQRAYICMDNKENAAKWWVISDGISDESISLETTYSSSKITEKLAESTSSVSGALGQKADKSDTYTKAEVDLLIQTMISQM